ncbi:MAG: hypothetical protein HKN92_02470 [Chitinophagales bacterium]|nr:hypothetical protein [Chitinophagales bacterium]
MKNVLTILCILLSYVAFAQYEAVVFDYEKSTFNENQPLPSEKNMMFSGSVSPQITLIDVKIYKGSSDHTDKVPLSEAIWKRPYGNTSTNYFLPINFKLKSKQKYNFSINYYRDLIDMERQMLRNNLFRLLDSYVDMTFTMKKKKISISKKYNVIVNDLDVIVEDGLKLYKNRNEMDFDGFSDFVKMKLKYIEELNLEKSSRLLMEGEEDKKKILAMRQQQIKELKDLLHNEVDQYLSMDWMILVEVKNIYQYPTEKTGNIIGLNAGYAAILYDFNFDDLDYGSSPYVGISIPLGNRAFKSSFLSNSSFSFGVFLSEMENNEGQTVTGPFIKRPLYAGLGYRVFKFIRVNAGATLIETEKPGNNKVNVKPFIGASIDFNFWLGIGDD